MQRQVETTSEPRTFPERVPLLSTLRSQMTLITICVVILFTVVALTIRLIIYFILQEPQSHLTPSKYIATIVPVTAVILGAIIGLAASRNAVRRVKRLVAATAEVARGNTQERVTITRPDEIGQLEHHFNLMAEQLAESMERQNLLTEQNARLAERTRISRDLHDSVKQHLFAVALQVGVALSQLDSADNKTRSHLREADALISLAQRDLTAIIQQLRPPALQQQGLASALREYAQQWGRQQRIAVEQRIEESGDIPHGIEEALWPVAVEALSNSARHSQATSVRVDLVRDAEQVTLAIADNGRGFEAQPGNRSGVGLNSMRERLEAVRGTLTIESGPGTGTSIRAVVPLRAPTGNGEEGADPTGKTARAAKEATR